MGDYPMQIDWSILLPRVVIYQTTDTRVREIVHNRAGVAVGPFEVSPNRLSVLMVF